MDLTPTARLRPSTALMDSKFEWRVYPFESLFPNQDSTPPATSGRAILRDISAGPTNHGVSWVFCPWPKVIGVIARSHPIGPSPGLPPASFYFRPSPPVSSCIHVDPSPFRPS